MRLRSCGVAEGRGGPKKPHQIKSFNKAWKLRADVNHVRAAQSDDFPESEMAVRGCPHRT